jgi:pullulanase
MLRVHYYRYDQDYTGWDLWIWEKGMEGSPHMFNYQEMLDGDPGKIAKVAEIDVSGFMSDQAGIIVRRGGWHERDLLIDRYFTITDSARTGVEDVYIVQDTINIYYSEAELCLTPGIETAVFENFREIYVKLQAPCKAPHHVEPFKILENGLEIPIRHVTQTRGAKEFLISLENDMLLGGSYMLYKPGFRIGPVAYGMIFDTPEFEREFTYDKDDLGVTWTPEASYFRLWAPTASTVFVNLFENGTGPYLESVQEMTRGEHGTWVARIPGDLSGKYYTYTVIVMGMTLEAADPYARSSGVNGRRSMILDMRSADPDGWEDVGYVPLNNPTDAVIYEVHVRDATIHESSGIKNRGKFLGLAEPDSKSPEGYPTGLSHFKDLGVTHVHLMPIFDFFTVDETRLNEEQYNWGYDPVNYNVPDGSYSTNPYDGAVRVRELKQMIKAFKEQGIGVVMDVVYNHTYKTIDSDFSKIVPDYYYRKDRSGHYSNGSGCGNEIASERSMVRKFITDSVVYWAREYKIDGFRFDLMGLHDIETMNGIRKALDEVSPSILIYGEGWAGGYSPLDSSISSTKTNAPKLNRIGFFNDNTRDAVRGDNFHSEQTGFITGNYRSRESVKFGIAGAVYHHGIDYTRINYNGFAWASHAWHCVNYVAAHDNLTLYDKLLKSRPDLDDGEYRKLVKLASAIVLTSQGIPFLMLGIDMMRSKKGEHNSYNSPDEINRIDWTSKAAYHDVFVYHQGLIRLRKAHPAFRMTLAEDIRRNLEFISTPEHMIAFTLSHNANNDPWKTIFVVFNAGTASETVYLPKRSLWNVVADENRAGTETLYGITDSTAAVAPRSALVLYSND